MQFDKQEMTIPAHWLTYIHYAECDCLEDGEADWIDQNIPGDAVIECEGEQYFSASCDLWFDESVKAGDVIDVNIFIPITAQK